MGYRLIWTMAACAVAFAFSTAAYWAAEYYWTDTLGAHGGGQSTLRFSMAVATALGIGSKILYDFIVAQSPGGDFPKLSIRKTLWTFSKSFLLAAIASPLVIVPLYNTLVEIDDKVLASLLCYQNGFFFQTIIAKKFEWIPNV
jgi:hypothetical protein